MLFASDMHTVPSVTALNHAKAPVKTERAATGVSNHRPNRCAKEDQNRSEPF
jgi:hypothetical protein